MAIAGRLTSRLTATCPVHHTSRTRQGGAGHDKGSGESGGRNTEHSRQGAAPVHTPVGEVQGRRGRLLALKVGALPRW